MTSFICSHVHSQPTWLWGNSEWLTFPLAGQSQSALMPALPPCASVSSALRTRPPGSASHHTPLSHPRDCSRTVLVSCYLDRLLQDLATEDNTPL